MLDNYRGIARHEDYICAVFELSRPVREGFKACAETDWKKPEGFSINIGILEYAYFAFGYFYFPQLGILLGEHDLAQITQAASDRIKDIGIERLPPVDFSRSIIALTP